jgi:RNA polymerase sigma-32 factor
MQKRKKSQTEASKAREADEIISADSDNSRASGFDSEMSALDDWGGKGVSPWELVDQNNELPPKTSSGSASKDLVRYDPLQSYLQEIKHIPTLSKEEEHELAVRYKLDGDKAAGLKLVVSNLKLVVMIAREHQRNVQNILDLVQEGNIGLLEAVEKYDPFRGIRFPSYAVYWVRAYILRYLINNIRLVKIGTTQAQRKLFFNLVKEKEKLEQEGFVPEAKLLAERLGVKESEVVEMQQRLRLPDVSVDAPVNHAEGESLDLHSILPSNQENVENLVIDADFHASVREGIEEFKETADSKEIAIIDQRLFNEEPRTLQEIADSFGISRERIRQIETRLKDRLKKFFTRKLFLDEVMEPEEHNTNDK